MCGFTDPHFALEHFKANSKDHSLVLSDLAMPNMSGFEFTRKIRLISPITRILIMTASDVSDSDLFRDLTSSLKIDGFIQKPIPLQSLKNIVQKYVT
jgi:response regulator RpfG family c-di-GMP phosphodiesterase